MTSLLNHQQQWSGNNKRNRESFDNQGIRGYDDNWTFRTGIAFDDSPVPADKRSISIPDQVINTTGQNKRLKGN